MQEFYKHALGEAAGDVEDCSHLSSHLMNAMTIISGDDETGSKVRPHAITFTPPLLSS